MFQQITIVGNLGNEPEMRYLQSGVPVASFRMAVNRTRTNEAGEKQEKVTWFRITAWRKLGETVSEYLHKGAKVLVVGEMEDAKPYTDKDGNLRANLEVTAQVVRFLETRGKSDSAAAGNGGQDAPTDEDGIPF